MSEPIMYPMFGQMCVKTPYLSCTHPVVYEHYISGQLGCCTCDVRAEGLYQTPDQKMEFASKLFTMFPLKPDVMYVTSSEVPGSYQEARTHKQHQPLSKHCRCGVCRCRANMPNTKSVTCRIICIAVAARCPSRALAGDPAGFEHADDWVHCVASSHFGATHVTCRPQHIDTIVAYFHAPWTSDCPTGVVPGGKC